MSREDIVPIVSVAMNVAQLHGAAVALVELENLLPETNTTEDLVAVLELFPQLRDAYVVRNGLVTPKSESAPASSAREEAQRRSMANISAARAFGRTLAGRDLEVIAVSGSTSYLSASARDDLDLFCVTTKGRVWVFLLKALVMARLRRLSDRRATPVTFSCVMDRKRADEMFSTDNGALFARDALMARVVSGHRSYAELLDEASWIQRYFPRLYGRRGKREALPHSSERPSLLPYGPLNLLLYRTVGSFIRAKASLHNRRLAREGKGMALFRLRIGADHLIYESRRYQALRSMYSKVASVGETGNRFPLAEEGE